MPIIDAIKEVFTSNYWSTVLGVLGGSTVIGGDLVGEAVKSASGQNGWAGVGVEAAPKLGATILAFAGGRAMGEGAGKNVLYGIGIGNSVSMLNDVINEAFRKTAAVNAMTVPGVIGARLGSSIKTMVLGSHSHGPSPSQYRQMPAAQRMSPQLISAERGVIEVPLEKVPRRPVEVMR